MILKTNCRHIRWDRPCRFHKETGVECRACRDYSPIKERILIIKMDSLGDVLRTTSILQGLKQKYPDSYVTWITSPGAAELLLENPYIDRVIYSDIDIFTALEKEKYDLVLNPDTAPLNAKLSSMANTKKRLGFIFKDNKVIPADKAAAYWYTLGMDDKLKKANKKTYQQIILNMLNIPAGNRDIILRLSGEERLFAETFAKKRGIRGKDKVIGLNTGAGKRWQNKNWPAEHTIKLIKLINKKTNAKILLYGGPEEKDRNKFIMSKAGKSVINTGTENSLREFIALVDLCGLMVVTDSLAMHIAAGLGKSVVALFGPTSGPEIELYGRGEHIITPLSCRGCYRQACGIKPTCMDKITPEVVWESIQKYL